MKYLLFLPLLFSCSTRKLTPVSPDEYLKLNKAHAQKRSQCLQHQKTVLDKAITETQDAELDDENYFFPRNEKKALSFLQQFDLSKIMLGENQKEYEAIVMACVTDRSPKHKVCETTQSAFKYFRGIIYGLRQYDWSPSTRKLAIDQTMSYIEYVGKTKASLTDILLANDLLMRLSDRGYVDQNYYARTIDFRRNAEKLHEKLREKLTKLATKELKCEDAQAYYQEEREQVNELGENFLKLLRNAD